MTTILSAKFTHLDKVGLDTCKMLTTQNPDFTIIEKDGNNLIDIVVIKPWGYEYLVLQNDLVSIWLLKLEHNKGTSFHCHENTFSNIICLNQSIKCETLDNTYILNELDCLSIDPGKFHSVSGNNVDSFALEILTPPDRYDLYRLKSYEGELYESGVSHSYNVNTNHRAKNTLRTYLKYNQNNYVDSIEFFQNKIIGIGTYEFLSNFLSVNVPVNGVLINIDKPLTTVVPITDYQLIQENDQHYTFLFILLKEN